MMTALTITVFAILLPVPDGGACAQSGLQQAANPPQVAVGVGDEVATRMRKLHLVRPDLLPYPMSYDIYC